ncbi:MAG: BTAD domain-containing putative transcriptional regulator [Vulcanimicrobiota bacterium]
MDPQSQLELLLRVNAVLHSSRSLQEIMTDLIQEVILTLKAQRGFVVVREEGEWRQLASHQMDLNIDPTWTFSRTVVDTVASTGSPVLTSNALEDQRFATVGSITLMSIRSIVCAPLRWNGQVQGVVYADSRLRDGIFRPEDLQVLSVIADQASRTLETAALHQQLQQIAQSHSDPAQAVDYLMHSLSQPSRPPVPAPRLPDSGLAIRLFGNFEVWLDGRPIEQWSTRKNRDLLAYLAAHFGQVTGEDRLMDLFWSQGGKSGLHSLHNSVTQLRKSLGKKWIVRRFNGYTLAPEVWVDTDQFSRAWREGRRAEPERAVQLLGRAESLAEGTFLDSFQDEWTEAPRLRLAEEVQQCRTLLAEHFTRHGKHVLAVELWKRVLQCDDCNEEGYRGLLQALRALGRQAEALRVYQTCVQAYARELDLEPPEEFHQLAHF